MEVSLDKGFYKYAVAHREGGGGSRVDARFRAIVGPGPTTLVRPNPGDPKQGWSLGAISTDRCLY